MTALDFARIEGPEDSKQANFSSLCSRIVMENDPAAKPVDGSGGDDGIDTYIGTFHQKCGVFQHKYFLETLGVAQRKQIISSLERALALHEVRQWTLMLPKDLTPAEIEWFEGLRSRYATVEMDWWGKTRLQAELAKWPHIARDFAPRPTLAVIFAKSDVSGMDTKGIADAIEKALGTKVPNQDTLLSVAREVQRRSRLKILLWGPTSDSPLYHKRVEIRTRLMKFGHDAKFPEEVWTPETLAQTGLNLMVAEMLQVMAFDYVVCLMESPGTIAEVHDFAKERQFAVKMMICIDHAHENGYSSNGALQVFEGLHGKLHWFQSPQDLTQCNLATAVMGQVDKVAAAKQYEFARPGG